MECRDKITEKLTNNSPFGIYFTRSSEDDLEKYASAGLALGMTIGRISTVADDYNYDPVEKNIKSITEKKYPSRSISFVVEGAQDGFTIKQYAAVYTCYMDGLSIGEPFRLKKYFTN